MSLSEEDIKRIANEVYELQIKCHEHFAGFFVFYS
ncbi:Protein of unknown function [Lactobacillus hominis DSM 23910 = CRBIP 24.179]|uniref:Uncharacterized protein n=1 Tax=Lactobacillus hominis DSM 23910 = CRBIP 24.179 TaxID=1423758 RepID=I7IW02_9LACO|nr:Protein of unknown function [Lactobacillus hominis DSM 23910 = CRBIP 24.179]